MRHLFIFTIGGLLLAGLVGCQATEHANLADQRQVRLVNASDGTTMPRVGQRVHVLLARYGHASATAAAAAAQPRTPLRAGDALGDQMFQRYVAQVRDQQHDDQHLDFAFADEPAWPERLIALAP